MNCFRMKQVIMFHSPTSILDPYKVQSRQVFTILPHEQVIVGVRVIKHKKNFHPRQLCSPSTSSALCFLVKNESCFAIKCKYISLSKLLCANGISHKLTCLSTTSLRKLHKKWLRGYKVWYTLRKMYILTKKYRFI